MIKKKDINSILAIIINIIIAILELVNKLLKSILVKPQRPEDVVLVNVRIDNLNEFSKLILSNKSMEDNKKTLIKKDIKIKKEIFMLSLVIFSSENKIFLLTILFGRTSFKISMKDAFSKI